MNSLFRALRHRPFALLWSGQTISRLGDDFYRIALVWWVLQKTGSAVVMGTVLICTTAPMLLFCNCSAECVNVSRRKVKTGV